MTDHQQTRVTGDVTLTIERIDDNWWFWSVSSGNNYMTGDDCGDYAHSELEAKQLAEFYAIYA